MSDWYYTAQFLNYSQIHTAHKDFLDILVNGDEFKSSEKRILEFF